MEILLANTFAAVTAMATSVVIVLVEPASSGSNGELAVVNTGDGEDDDEAAIRVFLGFLREN